MPIKRGDASATCLTAALRMSSSGNFGVAVRVRPDETGPKSCVKISGNTICIAEERHGREAEKSFTFDKVFDGAAKQEDVFAEVAGTVDAVPDGFHGCIFAYGPTGSGALLLPTEIFCVEYCRATRSLRSLHNCICVCFLRIAWRFGR